ncbi:MAG: hypothetical protein WC341_08030 [Bacteroidales bacterium]|jgi:hypothetical protein
MKYRLTEAQNELIAQLKKRKSVKEMQFINQAMGRNTLTEKGMGAKDSDVQKS